MNDRVSIPSVPAQTQIDALYRRYRENLPGPLPAVLPWSETIEGLLAHRSVRSYLPEPLPEGALEIVVAAASSAPTSSNVQAWSVVAVTDPENKARLADIAGGQAHIIAAPVLLVWIADLARVHAIGAAHGTRPEGADYTETFLLASIDAALAAQNALVAAESLGLGTVYIGALRNDPEEVARILDLPPHAYAVAGLVLGIPDPEVETAVKPRLPQQAVLHRERYSASVQTAAIVRHDEATAAFRKEQNLPEQSWSELVLSRLGTVAALKGRHVLRDVLSRIGFALK